LRLLGLQDRSLRSKLDPNLRLQSFDPPDARAPDQAYLGRRSGEGLRHFVGWVELLRDPTLRRGAGRCWVS
jgi:hypothetical protein